MAALPAFGCRHGGGTAPPRAETDDDASALMMPPEGPPLAIAMVAYPQMTALDLVGPQLFLASLLGVEVSICASSLDPVMTDTGFAILPTTTLAAVPERVDVLFVPGGATGTLDAMRDPAMLEFVASRGAKARWVSSTCTGALVLGAAGLLRGYRATTHWVAHEVLATLGAIAVNERVVTDRNRITGAGVSAGLDVGLSLAIALRGEPFARAVALNAEYAPAPPISAGTPATAGPAASRMLRSMYAPLIAEMQVTARASVNRVQPRDS